MLKMWIGSLWNCCQKSTTQPVIDMFAFFALLCVIIFIIFSLIMRRVLRRYYQGDRSRPLRGLENPSLETKSRRLVSMRGSIVQINVNAVQKKTSLVERWDYLWRVYHASCVKLVTLIETGLWRIQGRLRSKMKESNKSTKLENS